MGRDQALCARVYRKGCPSAGREGTAAGGGKARVAWLQRVVGAVSRPHRLVRSFSSQPLSHSMRWCTTLASG